MAHKHRPRIVRHRDSLAWSCMCGLFIPFAQADEGGMG